MDSGPREPKARVPERRSLGLVLTAIHRKCALDGEGLERSGAAARSGARSIRRSDEWAGGAPRGGTGSSRVTRAAVALAGARQGRAASANTLSEGRAPWSSTTCSGASSAIRRKAVVNPLRQSRSGFIAGGRHRASSAAMTDAAMVETRLTKGNEIVDRLESPQRADGRRRARLLPRRRPSSLRLPATTAIAVDDARFRLPRG